MNIHIKPVLVALKRHKAGAILIALQIAITLAIVSNVLFIVRQRIEHISLPTGIDEQNILVVANQWTDDKMPTAQAASLMSTDLTTIRNLSGVKDAYAGNAYPLGGFGRVMGVSGTPDQVDATTRAGTYFSDEHTIDTLGLKLISGRNFRPGEIGQMGTQDELSPNMVVVTKALAEKMFPNSPALGKEIYISKSPSIIIGIVEELRGHRPEAFASWWAERSMLVPYQLAAPTTYYIVRVEPGHIDALKKSIAASLFRANRMRIIDPLTGVRSYSEIRKKAYAKDSGMATLLTVISVILLFITASGIVGLTSFWVGQRRRQIGVRRALGATKVDILSYFLIENMLISSAGVIVGGALAMGMNGWMLDEFEMDRLPIIYVLKGVILIFALGFGAVLFPALNASRISPVESIRY
jgi:putative ABC transport system permease protein